MSTAFTSIDAGRTADSLPVPSRAAQPAVAAAPAAVPNRASTADVVDLSAGALPAAPEPPSTPVAPDARTERATRWAERRADRLIDRVDRHLDRIERKGGGSEETRKSIEALHQELESAIRTATESFMKGGMTARDSFVADLKAAHAAFRTGLRDLIGPRHHGGARPVPDEPRAEPPAPADPPATQPATPATDAALLDPASADLRPVTRRILSAYSPAAPAGSRVQLAA